MYIFKNAWKNITRNKGRNILIGIIVIVIAAASSITLAIRESANDIVTAYQEKNKIEATIGMNRNSLMELLRKDNSSQEDMINTFNKIESITEEEIDKYGQSNYVSDYYYTYNLSVDAKNIKEATDSLVKETTTTETETTTRTEQFGNSGGNFPGGMPLGNFGGSKTTTDRKTTTKKTEKIFNEKAQDGAFTLIGYDSYENMSKFISGDYTIIDGEVSSDFESNSVVISEELATMNELKVGNGIIAIGNALGYGQSVTTGVVSALNREVSTDEYTQDMIQIDAAINGENSGGALLNSKGEVVGINSAKYSSNGTTSSTSIEGMGFAIPISDVEDIIKDLINGKNDNGELTLGIEGYMTNSQYIVNYKLPEGFYISMINEGSNVDKSELEIGNIITEIDNNKVTSIETIKKVLNKKNKGDKVTLKVKYARKNQYQEKEISITLN